MNEFTIDGLTKEQTKLLDRMWSLHSEEEFDDWYAELDPFTCQQVDLMELLVLHAYMDDKVTDLTLANQAINKIKNLS
jgi:hypothetical protein|tara:strand:- start:1469 stop:1702 length:234 start_codon:yes stop_codon:yes gene_type:complete